MEKSLDRFLIAQQNFYHDAYTELKSGKKRSHWMWFIFPQIRGLGYSDMAKYYAIEGRVEAENYITNPTLGHNLIELSNVLLDMWDGLGPDKMRYRGILTDGIIANLTGLFDNVNTEVAQIAGELGTTPAGWNAGVFSMIRSLSDNVIVSIAGLWLIFRLIACNSEIYAFVSVRSITRIYPSIAILRRYAPQFLTGSCFIFSSISRLSSSDTQNFNCMFRFLFAISTAFLI